VLSPAALRRELAPRAGRIARRFLLKYLKKELRMISRKVGFLLFLMLAASAALGSSETVFEIFKGFEGKWAIRSGQKTLPIEMTYESGSKGSIVTEQFGKELSVFYRDGQSLLMTHFCNAGNQPRLRLRKNTRAGVFEFQMFDITNLQSADADHVERVVYKIIDDKTIDLEIVWKKGKSEESEKYTLTRIDSEKHDGN
jgi:hypothetical protein